MYAFIFDCEIPAPVLILEGIYRMFLSPKEKL